MKQYDLSQIMDKCVVLTIEQKILWWEFNKKGTLVTCSKTYFELVNSQSQFLSVAFVLVQMMVGRNKMVDVEKEQWSGVEM